MVVKFREPDADIFKVAALAAPGLVITVFTQLHWSRHKSGFTESDHAPEPAPAPVRGATEQEVARRRTRQRRRGRARGRR